MCAHCLLSHRYACMCEYHGAYVKIKKSVLFFYHVDLGVESNLRSSDLEASSFTTESSCQRPTCFFLILKKRCQTWTLGKETHFKIRCQKNWITTCKSLGLDLISYPVRKSAPNVITKPKMRLEIPQGIET